MCDSGPPRGGRDAPHGRTRFAGGDAGIEASLGNVYRENPDLPQRQLGVEPELWSFMGEARERLPRGSGESAGHGR